MPNAVATDASTRLEARDLIAIFTAFIRVMDELPPDTEAGWLNQEGDLQLAPDIGAKLRTARYVREALIDIGRSRHET